MLRSWKLIKIGLPVALPGAFSLMSGSVFAASEDKETDPALMTDELSLYTTPQSRVHCVKPEVGSMEQGVASLRKSAEPYITWCQEKTSYTMNKAEENYKTLEPSINTSVETIRDTFEFLNDPPSEFYPCVGVLGFSAILGLYLARGGKVKRFLYPAGLMTLSASMFYPQHAASLAKAGKEQILSWGLQGQVFLDELWKGKSSVKDEK
ncbi:apolipoprotein O, b [Trichomycterus rosablanca]|uniref:apolipoprotein O, b n=1 Tax=Trichomycterus rosablanca TaxID=2290929 RepID=UPI002F35A8CF